MLRKDVKLGFAIGGVMLAVLIVYVLVVPGTDHKTAQLITEDGQPTQVKSDKTPDGTLPPANVDGPSVDTHTGGLTSDKPADKSTDKPADKTTDKPADKTADNTKSDAPAVAGVTSGNNSSTPDIWGTALNDGTLPPTMMSTTPSPTNKGKAAVPPPEKAVAGAIADKPVDTTLGTTPTDKSAVRPPVDATTALVDPPANSTDRTHVVQQGETLTSIAAAVYSDGRQWKRIAEANPKVNPNRLKLGTSLVIPPAKASSSVADSAVPASATISSSKAAIDPQTQYQVQPSDSLYRISVKLYGKSDRLDKIYELNKDAIGPDRAKLKLHMILKLPEPPTVASTATASAR